MVYPKRGPQKCLCFPKVHIPHTKLAEKSTCAVPREVKKSFRDIQLSGKMEGVYLFFFQAFRGFPFDDFGEESVGDEDVMERNAEIFFSLFARNCRYAQ